MPKILVADDNTNIQKMVSLAFEERGIDVVSVGNGEAAVRRIPDVNPDLVLADIFMPVRNGYEVCEFVKKDNRFSHVPVILLVGAFDPLDEKEARRVGADGVLKKPFVPPDPLIAMVISALEKNPKAAAEMAKAREAAAAPPPPPVPPAPALDMPARVDVKPLPDFPEPSAEEAALAYGYSAKGGRGEDAKDKAPASLEAADVEEDDIEDAASAGGTWRNSAMDFEIPEETSRNTAFALDDDSATMFPSERDVPPKHVAAKKASKFAGVDTPEIPVASNAAPPATAAPVATIPPPPPPISVTPVAPPAAAAPPAPIATQQIISTEAAPKEVLASAKEIAVETVSTIESAPPSKATHWMDAMKADMARKDVEEERPQAVAALNTEKKIDAVPAPHAAAGPVAEVEVAAASPVPPSIAAAPEPIAEVAAAMASGELTPMSEPLQPESQPEDESFFAEDGQAASSWLPVENADQQKSGNPVRGADPDLELSGPVPVGRVARDPELVAEIDTSGPIAPDPALVQPPSVKVTPEPLLVDESPVQRGSGYGTKHEATAEPFEFADEPRVAVPEDESFAVPVAAVEEDEAAVTDERIPTGPPPNREALAEIAFLTPPPEFLATASASNGTKSDDQDVDALVRKVMEKLEPQLHNLLSQGVLKPLVENILQSDLAKKER